MNNVPSTTMKTTKQKDENGLRNLAMRYVRLEDFFAHGAHGKAKTPQEMLKKLGQPIFLWKVHFLWNR